MRSAGCGALKANERKMYIMRRIAPVRSPAAIGEKDELFLHMNPPSADERQSAIIESGDMSF